MKILATHQDKRAITQGTLIIFQEMHDQKWKTVFNFPLEALAHDPGDQPSQAQDEAHEHPVPPTTHVRHNCDGTPDREGRTISTCPGCSQQSQQDGHYMGFIHGADTVSKAIIETLKQNFDPFQKSLTTQMAHSRLDQVRESQHLINEAKKTIIQDLKYLSPIPMADRPGVPTENK